MKEKDWAERFGAEWGYVQMLGKAISDPEEKRNFWEAIKSRKLADSSYSIYDDFPMSENSSKKAMQEFIEFWKSIYKPGNSA